MTAADGLRYGLLGAPLAFAALPLYVLLPNHYAAQLGVPLGSLGGVLLAARALDAVIDPWLGRLADRRFAMARTQVLGLAALAAVLLGVGFVALFCPPRLALSLLLAWCATALVVTYLGYSALGVLHQAWGARLGGGAQAQARIAGWREGLALVGVLIASVLPSLAGIGAMVAACLIGLTAGWLALARAPYAAATGASARVAGATAQPWRQTSFRALLAVFLVNGVASAVSATLVLFFVRDRLQVPAFEPLFLGGYFAAGALSMPLWVRAVARWGLVPTWLIGMALAVLAFSGTVMLGVGDVAPFTAVCLASGVALGADLTIPGALLTGVIQRAGHAQRLEGAYLGWWNCATKLNLALAAGLALPALQALGYRPGVRDAAALGALAIAYAVLPCVLKVLAAALLFGLRPTIEGRTQ